MKEADKFFVKTCIDYSLNDVILINPFFGGCGLQLQEKLGSPGLVVCVSVDGRQVYAEGE